MAEKKKRKKKKKDMDLVTITVYLTKAQKARIRRQSAAADLSMTEYVQQVLIDSL